MPIHENTPVPSVQGQGGLPVGTLIRSFVLTDPSSPGMVCQVATLGATLTHLWVPDRSCKADSGDRDGHGILTGTRDIVLGFDDLTAYRQGCDPYFGASVGRVANRIAEGKFKLRLFEEDVGMFDYDYTLDQNNGPNALHGGKQGFSSRNWSLSPSDALSNSSGTSLRLLLVSEHLDQGYPGRIIVYCTYTLRDYCLDIVYEAHLDDEKTEATIVNLTNHSYFNLDGLPSDSRFSCIMDHELEMVNIRAFLELDDTLIPTGRLKSVEDVPAMDFRVPKKIRKHIMETPNGGIGYDHFFVSQDAWGASQRYAMDKLTPLTRPIVQAKVFSPSSGIQMTMSTTEPGFQLYTNNHNNVGRHQIDASTATTPNGRYVGKAYKGFPMYSGFCLETSRFPDAINQSSGDQVILNRGEKYYSKTTFAFSTRS
ncbi:hypothetical protein BGZ82_001340 [Podila clonocystis]|nr:hypothetical protein BGZ82_001340 [Podila clonocystis]